MSTWNQKGIEPLKGQGSPYRQYWKGHFDLSGWQGSLSGFCSNSRGNKFNNQLSFANSNSHMFPFVCANCLPQATAQNTVVYCCLPSITVVECDGREYEIIALSMTASTICLPWSFRTLSRPWHDLQARSRWSLVLPKYSGERMQHPIWNHRQGYIAFFNAKGFSFYQNGNDFESIHF